MEKSIFWEVEKSFLAKKIERIAPKAKNNPNKGEFSSAPVQKLNNPLSMINRLGIKLKVVIIDKHTKRTEKEIIMKISESFCWSQ